MLLFGNGANLNFSSWKKMECCKKKRPHPCVVNEVNALRRMNKLKRRQTFTNTIFWRRVFHQKHVQHELPATIARKHSQKYEEIEKRKLRKQQQNATRYVLLTHTSAAKTTRVLLLLLLLLLLLFRCRKWPHVDGCRNTQAFERPSRADGGRIFPFAGSY